ncbi:hypothetical protein SAMN05444506_10633 [Pseudomonas syringae]|uniref:Uncharacterized protein n=4 Tax=Pseudomonas TaxID=286 RepID=A0A3M3NFM2_9PSED|nr:hypothetical protein ALQ59_02315 [Pseudomonas syringae pv. apii]RMN58559.1 hypothetical protein ALQ58_100957 [Pseudomonas syringae pv. apii]RMN94824.1 hypothetical protein ALQ49_01721 [Pseudomonas syringae pv. apii]SDY82325.1 hypothetical protein SAMN05444506_10633 [Pseudomonas syringae]
MAMNGNAQALMSLYHHALLVSHLKPMKTAKNLRYRPAPENIQARTSSARKKSIRDNLI